jgi:hypothetical protein
LNKPKAISKPLIFVEVESVEHEPGSTIAAVGVLMATIGVESIVVSAAASMMVGDAVSMMVGEAASAMVGEAVSMSMGDAESTAVAGDEPTTLGDADESMEIVDACSSTMVGEGASKSIDPDPVVPTVGAN